MTVTTIWLLSSEIPKKPVCRVISMVFHKIQRNGMFSPKTVQPLKTQHFIRMRLKTPTVDIAPVKLYPYVKKQDANSCIWVCVLLLPVPTVPPWHIVYLRGETVEMTGFFAISSIVFGNHGKQHPFRSLDLKSPEISRVFAFPASQSSLVSRAE